MTSDYIISIFIAALLGGLIGLEREYRAKEAGLRTHFLVALGSALFMVLSQYGFDIVISGGTPNVSLDPSRIASQVVSGIGFIGAGIIIFQKNVIRGLTTAAGLWVTAAIGMTCGAGLYLLATATTVLVLLCLEALNAILQRFGGRNVSVTCYAPSKDVIRGVIKRMKREKVEVFSYSMREVTTSEGLQLEVSMELRVKRFQYEMMMFDIISGFEGVEIGRIE